MPQYVTSLFIADKHVQFSTLTHETQHAITKVLNAEFYVHVTVHRNKFLYNKTN
jgi:hypothetical protein